MTQYKFTVNGVSLTSALGWNANGTPQTRTPPTASMPPTHKTAPMAMTTSLASPAPLRQRGGTNLFFRSVWQYPEIGEPLQLSAIYSASTNRMTLLPGNFTAHLRQRGNLTNDNLHNYAWDADGQSITVDAGLSDAVSSPTMPWAACGTGSWHEPPQIVYSPTGQKLALMNGSTLAKLPSPYLVKPPPL